MQSAPIEDVVIGEKPKKKKGKGLKVGIFLLFIVLIVLIGLYLYFIYFQEEETDKEAFIKHIADNNIGDIFEADLYREILSKYTNRSYESNTSINFSIKNPAAVIEDENLSSVDMSKFTLNWNTVKDVDNKRKYNELGITYSSNDLYTIKIISDEDIIAMRCDEIVDQYVGVFKQDFSSVFYEVTGLRVDTTDADKITEYLNSIDSKNKLDIDKNFKKSKITKYANVFFEGISEEKFAKHNNFLLQDADKSIQTTAYILELDQTDLRNTIKQVLTEFRNDTELLSELVTGKDTEDVSDVTFDIFNEPNLDPVMTSVDGEDFEDYNESDSEYIEEDDDLIEGLEEIESTLIRKDGHVFDIKELITSILIGKKIDTNLENLQSGIDNYINEIDEYDGKGLKITIYVSDEGTEKIDFDLPDSSKLDIIFGVKSSRENKAIITYLKDEEVFVDDEETDTYGMETQRNGFKLEINRNQRETNEIFDIVYGNIKKEKIIQKTNINLVTTGTMSSKQYKFNLKISYSDNENTIETNINSVLNFDSLPSIETLNADNYLFLNALSEEDLIRNLELIRSTTDRVYKEKIESLNFIDANNYTPVIEQPQAPQESTTSDKETARQALIDTVVLKMTEAQDNGEQYTINDLENLQIQGHIVSVIVNEDIATITVDGYKFTIDTEFTLEELE